MAVRQVKNKWLLVAFPALWRIFDIFRRLDIRADVGHGETLVFFAGTGWTFPEILLALVKSIFLAAVNTDVFSRANRLSC
jgi:hypothetical protein